MNIQKKTIIVGDPRKDHDIALIISDIQKWYSSTRLCQCLENRLEYTRVYITPEYVVVTGLIFNQVMILGNETVFYALIADRLSKNETELEKLAQKLNTYILSTFDPELITAMYKAELVSQFKMGEAVKEQQVKEALSTVLSS